MGWTNAAVLIITSMVVFPVSYSVNLLGTVSSPVILGIGICTLLGVLALPYVYAWYFPHKYRDPFFFAWSIFTFACAADMIIALENDKILHSFMAFYIVTGEPYLGSTHGTLINYWDGVVHYCMYIFMVLQPSYNEKYRNMLLYWGGSIIHSVILILLTAFTGKYAVSWAILLNVAYLVLPVWMVYQVLFNPTPSKKKEKIETSYQKLPLSQRSSDLIFILFFLVATVFHSFRGVAVLDSRETLPLQYTEWVEPYLVDHVGFPRAQMLIYMFYFVPFYILTICALASPFSFPWLGDWAVIMAGAAAQGQFSHIGASLHPFTSESSIVPEDPLARTLFWIVNLSLFLGPQLFAVKCLIEKSIQIVPSVSVKHSTDSLKAQNGDRVHGDGKSSQYSLRKRKN